MTKSELESLLDIRVGPKQQVVVTADALFWKQSDGTWINYSAPVPEGTDA